MSDNTINKMMLDTHILDKVITRCADNTRRSWNDKTARDEYTGIIKFIIEARKNGKDYGDNNSNLDHILYPELLGDE